MRKNIISETTKEKIRLARIGKHLSNITKKKISEANKGEKNANWRGGISFKPYSVDWTETLKRSIRERDHYICQLCGKEPAITIHHIDYDKKNCNSNNLITLCKICHLRTNFNRKSWEDLFREIMLTII